MRRHTKKLFYRVWLRCIGRFTESTEPGASERTRAEVLYSVPALEAVTPSHHGVVTPVLPGLSGHCSPMPTGSSG